MSYNYLNLPNYIAFDSGSDITMTYSADGEKLTKVAGGVTKNYVSGIEYTGANVEAIYHGEGRCTPNGTSFFYEYTIKDHLGNARVTFRANGTAVTNLEDFHYYPFGMQMEGIGTTAASGSNKYRYNGKELNDDFGLNLSDYGARWYDGALGRWWSVDPMAMDYANYSAYSYGLNNPLIVIDPTGGNAEIIIDMDKKQVTIKVDLFFYGEGLNPSNFDAKCTAESIEDQWNNGAKGAGIKVNGESFATNFQVSGTLKTKSEINQMKKSLADEKNNNSGTSWARSNYIEVGKDLPSHNISENEATFKADADPTTYAHEVGHLMGLDHTGGFKKGVPVVGQPGIMATINNSVDPQYTIDGKPTKWQNDANGQPYKTTEGKLDVSKRKVLPSEVQNVVNLRQGKGSNGKSYVKGIAH